MLFQKIKWMAVGVAITASTVWVYNHKDAFRNLTGSNHNSGIYNKINPEFATYISAFTTGYISTGSPIRIKFANEFSGTTELNKPLKEDFFSFEPSIDGEAVWKDGQTIEFRPKERLKPGQLYKATFHLDKLVEVKKELEDFEFGFQAIRQSIQLETNELKSYNSGDFSFYSFSGAVSSADFIKPETVEQTLTARLGGKTLNVKWMHNEKGTSHKFLIDSIGRSSSDAKLVIECDGKKADLPYSASQTYEVPKKDAFRLLGTKVVNDNEQFVQLTFSNPIDQNQILEGLISLIKPDNTSGQNEYDDNRKQSDIKYIASNNHVLIYPNKLKAGSYLLKVGELVKDAKGQLLGEESTHNVVFDEVKPAIRFIGEGNILPSTNGLNMPFETVNLRAVDVKIIKIYENNVLQFLQSNDLDGSSQLAQVGKKIIEKRINLGMTNPAEFGTWKKFSLDLSSLIKAEPGAIYKVYIGMRKSYSTYSCLGNEESDKFEMEEIQEPKDEEVSFYGYYYEDEYSGGYYGEEEDYDYNWEDRDNPCKAYYYRQYERTVSRSIIASDLGLTFKKGNDGSYLAVVNDLVSTDPVNGVSIELYDYQKQLIQSATTNKDGQAFINVAQRPYFIVAKKDNQRAYLRLDDGTTLSMSMYDVSGEAIRKGLKGFIYGERGVWRPGDSLFLNFILEDKLGSIPANHPVVFELTNPQGQLYKRILSNKGVNGFYNFSTATDKNVPTGLWNVEVKVGSIRFYKSVRIETIMPNRLKIEVNAGDNKLIVGTKPTRVSLHTQWLTGAVAHNLAANITANLYPATTEFPKFKDYNFDDNTVRFNAQNITVFDGNVDDNGNTSFPLKLDIQKNAPGFLTANFTTRVFEQGGAFSIDRFSVDYSPFTYYCGVKLPEGEKNTGILYTGKDHNIEVATVDYNGNPVSRSNLRFELYKLEWRWWWDQYNDELANYANDDYHKAVKVENFSTKGNGTAKINVNIKENQWGRYLIRIVDLDGGHTTTQVTYFDWANWMERDGGENNKVVANMLHFNTDKTSYKTNEEVSVTIPSPQNGRALVTIENGSRVLEAHWLETEKGSTVFKFKVTPEMAPNVYVHVSLMQPHSRTNDLPIRLYGVVPINIDDPETHLKPTISMPATLMPEKKADITVSEENGKEMAFTIAVVDEGLLDITRFKTPNPWGTFYAKEALGVKTWDLYDKVLGAFGAELERVLSIGGDGSEAGSEDGAKANRFKPMVKFFGPYQIKKGEKKTISFQMPSYIGSVRTMVIAGNKGSYGMAEKTTPVKAPLMLLGTLPRVLSVTEEVKLPVTIFGGDKNVGKTDVKLEVNGLLQVVGGNLKSVNIGANDEKMVAFDIKVKNQAGIGKAKIIATGGGHTAVYEIELDVRNPNPYQTTVKDFFVDGGKDLKENFTAMGLAGTNSGALELSTIPPINLDERLHYLITYPHGCVEQTTSQTFAQLYLTDIMDLSPEKKTEIERNIKYGINELHKFQLSNGAMSYWQGMNEPNDWGTTYSGHFMMLAEKKGYTLPAGFKKSWINYQSSVAMNYETNKYYNNDVNQAYRLYVLTLAGQPALSAMNRLREYAALSQQARWLLAAAYAQIGQQDEAEKLIATASTSVPRYYVNYYTYGSSDRDEAMILEALCLMGKKTQAFAQLKKVSAFLSSKSWLSTQTTAYGLVSVASFIKKYGDASAMQAEVEVNGKDIDMKGNSSIKQIPIDFKGSNSGNFTIENNGKGMLYARLITRGKPGIGTEVAGNENISMEVAYTDMGGAPITVDELAQGTDFMMKVTVKNLGLLAGDIQNLALTTYIPSGWEIHNSRLDENEPVRSNNFTYQDIKDDKVLTYFDLGNTQSKTFNIVLNAAYEGKYYLPAVNTEAMYDNTVYARNKGQWIRVIKGKGKESVAAK